MANTEKCMIIGASPLTDSAVFTEFNPRDYYVICADGGYDTALQNGIVPDYVVGDFDSVKKLPTPKNRNIKVLPAEKDVTDTMYAAMLGLELKKKTFVLIGCLHGPRYDHTIANINVMHYISKHGGTVIMADSISKTFLLHDSRLRITNQKGAIVSVFPFGTTSCTVSYKGLKYPLHEQNLTSGDALMGVSNEIVDEYAEIVVYSGFSLIIVYNN